MGTGQHIYEADPQVRPGATEPRENVEALGWRAELVGSDRRMRYAHPWHFGLFTIEQIHAFERRRADAGGTVHE